MIPKIIFVFNKKKKNIVLFKILYDSLCMDTKKKSQCLLSLASKLKKATTLQATTAVIIALIVHGLLTMGLDEFRSR